jgi:ectoine hydroxylase
MEFVRLSDAQRQSFNQDGFLVVRNALNADALQRVVAASDRMAGPFLTKPEVLGRPEYNHLDLRPGLLREDALLDLVTHGPTVSLVVQLMTPNIHLHSTALIYKRPETTGIPKFRRGWHRDIRIPRDLGHQSLPLVGIKICYCLTDFAEPDSGMTLMARTSHLKEQPLAIRNEDVDPDDVEVCDLQLNAGDAFLFENRVFHTATPNRSNRTSKVLMYGYAYRWMRTEVYLEVPDQQLLNKSEDPIARQLLGGYRDVDTYPWALQEWSKRNGVQRPPVPWTVDI